VLVVGDIRQLGYIRSVLGVRVDAGEFWPKRKIVGRRGVQKAKWGGPRRPSLSQLEVVTSQAKIKEFDTGIVSMVDQGLESPPDDAAEGVSLLVAGASQRTNIQNMGETALS
jgi:hypothetical protein